MENIDIELLMKAQKYEKHLEDVRGYYYRNKDIILAKMREKYHASKPADTRPRGRPRKEKQPAEKKKIGRPRKYPLPAELLAEEDNSSL